MITHLILDVDGVLTGSREGVNMPLPHHDVLAALRTLHLQGIAICLCTGRTNVAVTPLIRETGINSFHVTDGGAVIINPLQPEKTIVHAIEADTVLEVLNQLRKNNIFTELYTLKDYFVEQTSPITSLHTKILQCAPKKVLLTEIVETNEIVKILPIAQTIEEKNKITEILRPFNKKVALHWNQHPLASLQFGVVTAPGISKKNGVNELIALLSASFDTALGVGDSDDDWQFMQDCRYAATLENAPASLKTRVQKKDGFIAPSVDDNGILTIFKHFNLIK